MARAIDGDELLGIERLLDTDVVRQSKTASWLLDQVLHDIQAMPTLTSPNEPLTCEGCKFEYEATDEAMCEQCIRSPAYRDYYRRPPEGEEDT